MKFVDSIESELFGEENEDDEVNYYTHSTCREPNPVGQRVDGALRDYECSDSDEGADCEARGRDDGKPSGFVSFEICLQVLVAL